MLNVDSVSELSRDIAFGQQCPRVSRRLHRAQRSLAATLPLSRVSFAYVVAPCTLPSKWWGRVLKHRIFSVPQRTCVQGRTTKRVMVSSAPSGIMLHVVVIHASSIRVLACVNMEWLHSVRTVIRELRRGFLDGDFHVDCLAPEVQNGRAKLRAGNVSVSS